MILKLQVHSLATNLLQITAEFPPPFVNGICTVWLLFILKMQRKKRLNIQQSKEEEYHLCTVLKPTTRSASDANISVSYLWYPFPGQCMIEHIIVTPDLFRWIIFIVFIHSSGTCGKKHDCVTLLFCFHSAQP